MLDLQLGRVHPRTKPVLDAKLFDNKLYNLFNFFLIIQQCLPRLRLNCDHGLYYFHPC